MSGRLFTPQDVNALIPELTERMAEVMESHRQASALVRELREARRHIEVSGGGLIDPRDWNARAERLDGLGIAVRQGVERVMAMGGVVKDPEMGLVDFPGLAPGGDDEPVNLCWRYGETAVRFWHGFDEGYAQRKPLP